MKRLGLFILILLSVIVAFYMQPVLFPPVLEAKKKPRTTDTKPDDDVEIPGA